MCHKDMENFRLKVLRSVARHLNFRRAAEELFLTQPAVTMQIKALEQDLGVQLFDRSGSRITLTPAGALLVKYAGDNGFGVIMDTSNPWPNGPVLWAGPSVDITKPVVDAYNVQSGVPAPAPEAPKPGAKPAARPAAPGTKPPAPTTPPKQ